MHRAHERRGTRASTWQPGTCRDGQNRCACRAPVIISCVVYDCQGIGTVPHRHVFHKKEWGQEDYMIQMSPKRRNYAPIGRAEGVARAGEAVAARGAARRRR